MTTPWSAPRHVTRLSVCLLVASLLVAACASDEATTQPPDQTVTQPPDQTATFDPIMMPDDTPPTPPPGHGSAQPTENLTAVAMALGGGHTCAITTTGIVTCFGDNRSGQLGNGSLTESGTPLDVSGLTGRATAIAAGAAHTCALMDGGRAWCWGNNDHGQLGDGTTNGSSDPVAVVGFGGGATAIAAGSDLTCALMRTGGVKCWGANDHGQLGNGTTTGSATPVDVVALGSGVTAIAVGNEHACAILAAGEVRCWGRNDEGQLGAGTTGDSGIPLPAADLGSAVTAVTAGGLHTCAILAGGGLKCWGRNDEGQLGTGTTGDSAVPVDVVGLAGGVAGVTAGGAYTCAFIAGGPVRCWGENTYGQLGNGSEGGLGDDASASANSDTPVDISAPLDAVIAVRAGGHHTCALTRNDGIWCWGTNSYGEIGPASGYHWGGSPVPTRVGPDSHPSTIVSAYLPPAPTGPRPPPPTPDGNAVAIAAGGNSTCEITRAGGVRCWGARYFIPLQTEPVIASPGPQGSSGFLSLGSEPATPGPNSGVPVDVPGLTGDVIAIAVGATHSCVLTSPGGVKCWGLNEAGQLGDGSLMDSQVPVDVVGLASGAVAVAVGGKNSCALLSDGGVKCWGAIRTGQLPGNGGWTIAFRTQPVDVPGLPGGARAIAAGDDDICALTGQGGVRCWGDNIEGQLGNGTTDESGIPVDVLGLSSGVTAIAVGGEHACALKIGGGIKCWGYNEYGALGNGTSTLSRGSAVYAPRDSTPSDVVGLSSGVTAIVAGGSQTCAIAGGGQIKCWGASFSGALGTALTTDDHFSSTPVDVADLDGGVTQLAAGGGHTCALLETGNALCWGANEAGQLGNGTTVTSRVPSWVHGL